MWRPDVITVLLSLPAASQTFHDAPASAKAKKNPYAGQPDASLPGQRSTRRIAAHATDPLDTAPPIFLRLAKGSVQSASDGEIFWFITKGDLNNGMPSWEQLPAEQRWQIVSYVKSLPGSGPVAASQRRGAVGRRCQRRAAAASSLHRLPFREAGKYAPHYGAGPARSVRHQVGRQWSSSCASPGQRVAASAGRIQSRAVRQRAQRSAFDRHRPQWRFFCGGERCRATSKFFAASRARALPEQVEVFASGLNQPYGIAFYPPGPNPQWVYVGRHQCGRALSLPEWRHESARRGAAHCRCARRRRTLDARHRILARRQEDVRRRGLGVQRG